MNSATGSEKGGQEGRLLENIAAMSDQVAGLKERCSTLCSLLDEGTHKIDAVLNIINNLKVKERAILSAGGDQAVVQQMSEEQIDSILDMLKSPAFHSLLRQLLVKWASPGGSPAAQQE
ncbi:MAG: hypothetical protein QHH10_04650 [Peptococcaceae bacterium]|jgi:hypothetical protein|nr:hypothetical protein [Peptococcaceae bacterium]MDH7524587.1 hypothetical protein [Peptococcaceae bacterium]